MSYSVIGQATVDRKPIEKTTRKIDGSKVKHLFDYKPDRITIYATEFLCDCDDCLDFRIGDCFRKQTPQEQSLLNESKVPDVIPMIRTKVSMYKSLLQYHYSL